MKWLQRFSREGPASVHAKREYEATGCGRRYGWWVYIDRQRVADLNYRSWDCDSQFWHTYSVVITDPKFDGIGFDPDKWCLDTVSFCSRYAPDFAQQGALMSDRGDMIVAIRSLCVPEAIFQQALHRAELPTGTKIAEQSGAQNP